MASNPKMLATSKSQDTVSSFFDQLSRRTVVRHHLDDIKKKVTDKKALQAKSAVKKSRNPLLNKPNEHKKALGDGQRTQSRPKGTIPMYRNFKLALSPQGQFKPVSTLPTSPHTLDKGNSTKISTQKRTQSNHQQSKTSISRLSIASSRKRTGQQPKSGRRADSSSQYLGLSQIFRDKAIQKSKERVSRAGEGKKNVTRLNLKVSPTSSTFLNRDKLGRPKSKEFIPPAQLTNKRSSNTTTHPLGESRQFKKGLVPPSDPRRSEQVSLSSPMTPESCSTPKPRTPPMKEVEQPLQNQLENEVSTQRIDTMLQGASQSTSKDVGREGSKFVSQGLQGQPTLPIIHVSTSKAALQLKSKDRFQEKVYLTHTSQRANRQPLIKKADVARKTVPTDTGQGQGGSKGWELLNDSAQSKIERKTPVKIPRSPQLRSIKTGSKKVLARMTKPAAKASKQQQGKKKEIEMPKPQKENHDLLELTLREEGFFPIREVELSRATADLQGTMTMTEGSMSMDERLAERPMVQQIRIAQNKFRGVPLQSETKPTMINTTKVSPRQPEQDWAEVRIATDTTRFVFERKQQREALQKPAIKMEKLFARLQNQSLMKQSMLKSAVVDHDLTAGSLIEGTFCSKSVHFPTREEKKEEEAKEEEVIGLKPYYKFHEPEDPSQVDEISFDMKSFTKEEESSITTDQQLL